MSIEGERQQHEVDVEVAASRCALRQHAQDQRERVLDRRDDVLCQGEVALRLRDQVQGARGEVLDARERDVAVREQLVDQREIDSELVSWPATGSADGRARS